MRGKHLADEQAASKGIERNWGHYVILVLSALLGVASLIVVIYCGLRLHTVLSLELEGIMSSLAVLLYITGLVACGLTLPPAIVGLIVGIRGKGALVAICLAVIALILAVAFAAYALLGAGSTIVMMLACFALLAILPTIYLVAALKVRRSSKEQE